MIIDIQLSALLLIEYEGEADRNNVKKAVHGYTYLPQKEKYVGS